MADFDTREQLNAIIFKYAANLKKHLDLHSVYLFGSYANGKNRQDSDIDVAVVAEGFSGDIIEDTHMLMKLRRNIDNRIEPHPFSLHEFTVNNPFVREIINNGIKVI
ncbi:nucleotidyltransferase domain-containing protein [Desulfitobacterium sp. PCE1]|uniref:nucleotidyltransferase domain-containing protein n=1 Tax=Desulfitobacterium sp. PCE1 TaxID=146907 RepID=UPI0003710835|nr:nucleotidyltransferase domain-containing protein [Desulfitobacterium sp. PCE1]